MHHPDPAKTREFIERWAQIELNEKAVAQSHFAQLCHLLGVPAPADDPATQHVYRFEKPLAKTGGGAGFARCAEIGGKLAALHLGYEQAAEYPLQWETDEEHGLPSWRVEKMKLSKDKTAVVVNDTLTLHGLPPECFAYRLGNRSAVEWVIDQYRVKTDKRSGITSDPNRDDDAQYIPRLLCKVVTVSVETVALVAELAQVALGVGE